MSSVVNRNQTPVGARCARPGRCPALHGAGRTPSAPTNPFRDALRPGLTGILAILIPVLAAFAFVPELRPAAQGTSLPSRIEPKAQELLTRSIEALGGEQFLKFKTLYTKGRAFVFSEGETAGMEPYESTTEYPDKRRFSYGKWPPVVLINDGDSGWEIDRFGIIRQRPDQIRHWKLANRYSLENLLREVLREPGLLVQSGGVDFVDAAPAFVLDLVDTRQVRVRVYLHQTSFLPLRIAYQVQDPDTHEWQKYEDSYGDYQKIQGIETPKHVGHFLDDERITEIYRNEVVYDKAIPPGFFEPGNPKGVS
jgi:hypothetical protein